MLFFHVRSAAEARRVFARPVPLLPGESVELSHGRGRILAAAALAPVDLPEFARAVVDGFAVRAADTFGASPGLPAYLRLDGEVPMGAPPPGRVEPGACLRIATGGMLPEGADAVVMLEHAETAAAGLVEIHRPAAPGEGMVASGDDFPAGAPIVPAGRVLGAAQLGALAAAGVEQVVVFRRPRVAVIPTGDELVPADGTPGPGQVRDVNSPALAAAVREAGGEPATYPIVPDDPEALRAAALLALDTTDLVLVAGGSSVGARDWTLEVLLALPGAELLLHGAAIRPGKPVIAVGVGERLVVGLPGNPVSALVVFDRLVRPYLRRLAGESRLLPEGVIPARLSRSVSSDPGKEDYVRVRLLPGEEGWIAEPLLGKSSLIASLAGADGLFVIPESVEGLEAGEMVEVLPG